MARTGIIDLVELIRGQCVPQRNCLLTVTEVSGESGFLYFRDAELIEANVGTIWGREAFDKIISWRLAQSNVSDLPMGIKRAIWEPVDVLIEDVLGAGAGEKVRTAFQQLPDTYENQEMGPLEDTVQLDARRMVFATIRNLPHFRALYTMEDNRGRLLLSVEGHTFPDPEWIVSVYRRMGDVGQSLGGGKVRGSCLTTDSFWVWIFDLSGYGVAILTDPMEETHTFLAAAHDAMALLK